MGRPRSLTPEVIDEVVAIIGPGVRRKDAALAAGISESAYYLWLARGNREQARMDALGLTEPNPDEAIFVQFLERTTHAWAQAKATALVAVRQAMHGNDKAPPDWRAAAWWLERTYPREYGLRRVAIELEQHDGIEVPDSEDVANAIATAAEQYLEQQTAAD